MYQQKQQQHQQLQRNHPKDQSQSQRHTENEQNDNQLSRSATPLILTESGHGIESIRISCDSPAISMDVRSISPPAKLFHCAVSPRRRPPRHAPQRLQRPHRPCLDFDKMQQVNFIPIIILSISEICTYMNDKANNCIFFFLLKLKARSVTAWRHNNEHTGELSVFCW